MSYVDLAPELVVSMLKSIESGGPRRYSVVNGIPSDAVYRTSEFIADRHVVRVHFDHEGGDPPAQFEPEFTAHYD